MPEVGSPCVLHQCDLTERDTFPRFSARILFHVASLWLLPDRIGQFHDNGVQRIVAIGSTSRFSKEISSSAKERAVAESFARAEDAIANACEKRGIAYTIFRPTLIYGSGRDRNVADIARFVRRFGVFPILGKGSGLRQPIHADDLAQACILASNASASFNQIYNLSGGETVTYRQMVERIFLAMGKPVRIVSIPEPLFRLAIWVARRFRKYEHLTPEMAMRMDRDLCFDHNAAVRDFGYSTRFFYPNRQALGMK